MQKLSEVSAGEFLLGLEESFTQRCRLNVLAWAQVVCSTAEIMVITP